MRPRLCAWPLAAVLMSGCGARVDLSQPPDIRLGEDACDHCKMIINEARFAAGYYESEGAPRRFDDIGCLVAFVKAAPAVPPTIWVHAYEGDAWLRADEASFVVSEEIHTAMGSGIVAVESKVDAERLAADGKGQIATLEELISGTLHEQ